MSDGRLGHDFDLRHVSGFVAIGCPDAVASRVAPPMMRIFLPLQLMMSLGGMTMPSRIRFCCDNSSRAKWTPFRLRPSMGRSRGTSEPMAIQTASNVEAISFGGYFRCDHRVDFEDDPFLFHQPDTAVDDVLP